MELNSNEVRIPQALEFALAHSAQCGLLPYGIFARCGAVSRGWRGAVDTALRMFVHLHFRGHEANEEEEALRRQSLFVVRTQTRIRPTRNMRHIAPFKPQVQ